MTFDVKLDIEPMTLSADMGQVTNLGGGGCGEKLEGKTFEIDGEEVTAQEGAERFNLYDGEAQNVATGMVASAFGEGAVASGDWSFASGYYATASGAASRSHGNRAVASGKMAVAEGTRTLASANNAHAEGDLTQATANNAHAEGYQTRATKNQAHAEGAYSEANALYTHAEGWRTKADSPYQHVEGKANIADADSKYLHIIGNGTSDTARSNAHTLDKDGNAWYAGEVYVGSTSGTNRDDGSQKLVTAAEVANRPSSRIMSEDGGNYINLSKSEGISLVDKLKTLTERGLYTLYVSKGCPDNPPHAEAINSSLRGICHISLTGPENGNMYAWILLFDAEGNMYTRYTSASESTWMRYAIASD